MKFRFFLALLLTGWATAVLGNSPAGSRHQFLFKHISLSVGNWYEMVGDVQTTEDGDTSGLLDMSFNPFISIAADHEFNARWAIIPEIGYVIRRNAGDEAIDKDLFFFRGDIAYSITKNFRLRAGSSFMVLSMSSDGGEKSLPNGDSTQTFYRPDERSTAVNLTFDLGMEYWWDNMSARLQSYTYALTQEDQRSTSVSLSFNYHIPLEDIL